MSSRQESTLIKHIQNIRTSGTILPSSGFLVERLVRGIDFANATLIIEFGVGTGCVTRQILRRMRSDARLISLEINAAFVEEGRRIRDPRLTVHHACATALPRIMEDEGITAVDAVVSSLPLSIMDSPMVDQILDVARDSLAPGGRFLQYQYSLSQRHRLSHRYNDVAVGFTPFNIPPAFVYQCSQEAAGGGRTVKVRPAVGSFYAGALAGVAMIVRAFQNF
ncbi:MAG TPA: methyltransferase domain-containing protein [Longimicrobiales bacterium]|nr:methyltransferase domain-containing protein [Longimicrobiales bacterium]